MPSTCPQCAFENPDGSGFCVRCGNRLQRTGQTIPFSNQSIGNPGETFVPTMASSASAQLAPSYSPPIVSQPQYPPLAQPWGAAPAYSPVAPAQMGSSQGLASIRRAFAGKGELIMHHSWLLEGKQLQAVSVLTAIKEMLAQRHYVGLTVTPEHLTERGVMMEQRDYLTVHRSGSTVFVYVAPAGDDLYISRATAVQPPISILRVVILILMLAVIFIGPSVVQNIITSLANPANSTTTGSSPYIVLFLALLITLGFIYAYIPILIFLLIFLVRSFINWLVDKDFWVYLRPNVLNDFQMDDIALLEHSTDKIVGDAVQQLGLDASKIVPPPQGYQPKRKIRIV
jgi:hypothetical protein